MNEPPRTWRRFMGLPYRWWRRLPHLFIPVYFNEVGHVKCAVCWLPDYAGGPRGKHR